MERRWRKTFNLKQGHPPNLPLRPSPHRRMRRRRSRRHMNQRHQAAPRRARHPRLPPRPPRPAPGRLLESRSALQPLPRRVEAAARAQPPTTNNCGDLQFPQASRNTHMGPSGAHSFWGAKFSPLRFRCRSQSRLERRFRRCSHPSSSPAPRAARSLRKSSVLQHRACQFSPCRRT